MKAIVYTKHDFTRNGQQYDLILAVNGYHPIAAYKRALTPTGTYVMAGSSSAQIFQAILLGPGMSRNGDKKMGGVSAKFNQKDLAFIKRLLEAGQVVPVIDQLYPLPETAHALRYLGQGHTRTKVVITVAHNRTTQAGGKVSEADTRGLRHAVANVADRLAPNC